MAQVAKKARKKTAKKKPASKKMARAKKPTRKAYHIFRFTERFEIRDPDGHFRKKPLLFTRDFVGSGNDDESIHYAQQISLAEHSPNYHILRSVFYKLKNIAAQKSKHYRGYILEGFKPATKNVIAHWVGLNAEKCKEILDELLQIGLLEYIPSPDYEPIKDEITPEKKTRKKKKSGGTGRSRKKSGGTGRSRKKSGETGRDRNSFQERVKYNENGKYKNKEKKKNNKKETPVKPALSEPEKTKGKAKSKTKPLHQKVKDNIRKMREQRKALAPDNPREPDAGEAKQSTITGSLPSSFNSKKGIHRYSDQAKEFGNQVFITLNLHHVYPLPYSKEAHSELGCFAAAWEEALSSGLSAEVLDGLWIKSIDSARVKAKQKNIINRGACWRSEFNKRLAARKRNQAG